MKKTKKFLILILALISAMSFCMAVGCGDDETVSEEKTYTVVFDMNGATSKQIESQEVKEGEKVKEPTAPQFITATTETTFVGWYNGSELWDFENSVVTGNMILTAKWKVDGIYTHEYLPDEIKETDKEPEQEPEKEPEQEPEQEQTFLVTFDMNGATSAQIASQEIKKGEKVKEPEAPKLISSTTVATFIGWYNGSAMWNFENSVVTGNITLTAKWKVDEIYTHEYLPD